MTSIYYSAMVMWYYPLLVVIYVLSLDLCFGENKVCKTKNFQLIYRDSVIFGHVIATHEAESIAVCMFHCYHNNDCHSYNYKNNGLCEINNSTLKMCPGKREQKEGYEYYENVDDSAHQSYGSEVNPGKSCLDLQQCGKSEGKYWIMYNNTKTFVHCKHGQWIKMASDVCVGAKDNSFGKFQSTELYPVLVEKVKLVYISGSVGCRSASSTKWGCDLTSGDDYLLMLVTDHNNAILYPSSDIVNGAGAYRLPGYKSTTSPELLLTGDVTYLKLGDEVRIWYGEDLLNKSQSDNHGSTCMDVWVYML